MSEPNQPEGNKGKYLARCTTCEKLYFRGNSVNGEWDVPCGVCESRASKTADRCREAYASHPPSWK